MNQRLHSRLLFMLAPISMLMGLLLPGTSALATTPARNMTSGGSTCTDAPMPTLGVSFDLIVRPAISLFSES